MSKFPGSFCSGWMFYTFVIIIRHRNNQQRYIKINTIIMSIQCKGGEIQLIEKNTKISYGNYIESFLSLLVLEVNGKEGC